MKLWHDASEEPKFMNRILVEKEVKNVKSYIIFIVPPYDRSKRYWDIFTKSEHVIKWAYIEDLLQEQTKADGDKANCSKKELTIKDVKQGDYVAFEFYGNTAVALITDNDGWFDYAVGLWMDGNLIGCKDAIWYADCLDNVNTVEPIKNLRYANIDDVKRFTNEVIRWYKRGEELRERLNDESLDRKSSPSVGDILSIWHEYPEIPVPYRDLLIHFTIDSYERFATTMYSGMYDWPTYAKNMNMIQWAYIDEILPHIPNTKRS